MNEDFLDFLRALDEAGARFLVIGAHAMSAHGTPRATGDLDVWVEADGDNAVRVWRALADFGAPLATLGVTVKDFASACGIVQLGVPPRRIDLLTEIDGVTFASAWRNRFTSIVGGRPVPFLSYDDLLRNKRAVARPKDLLDIELLERNHRTSSERE